MLILTRRVGESLMVGDEVTLTVLGVKGNQVRIGVNAPKEIPVHREEIYRRIQHEKLGGQPNCGTNYPNKHGNCCGYDEYQPKCCGNHYRHDDESES